MLDKFMDDPVLSDKDIKILIKRRRAQMLIHSCIYYHLDDNIISDHKWQEWADELQKLQEDNPKLIKIGFYDKTFIDWTGATGNHLPHLDPWVLSKSKYILRIHYDRQPKSDLYPTP
jgi:hypothetical protein